MAGLSFINPIVLVLLVGGVSYFGSKLLIAPRGTYTCNQGVQSFETAGETVYWRVNEGMCARGDLNYNVVLHDIESQLARPGALDALSDAVCSYSTGNKMSFAYAFGKDYYAVEEADCLAPLRKMQEDQEREQEAELEHLRRQNADKAALKEKVRQNAQKYDL